MIALRAKLIYVFSALCSKHTNLKHLTLANVKILCFVKNREMEISYHGIYKLDSIIFRRIVTGGNHYTDGLAIELPGSQSCEQARAENDRIE
jgi:hypothetical protein